MLSTPVDSICGHSCGSSRQPEEKDPLAALTATIDTVDPKDKKKRKKAVLKTAATLANITTTIQTLTRNGLAPKPVAQQKIWNSFEMVGIVSSLHLHTYGF